MSEPSSKPKLALIAGPTASGKSALGVDLAQALMARGQGAAIVNADSAQVYADLRVLSARPTEDEMGGVPHRLFGTWDGAIPCSAADWAASAKKEIAALREAGVVPILVGGTGLYINTLLYGIAPVPPIDPDIRVAVRAMPQHEARAALEREDSGAASRLAPADVARTCRALEVVRSTSRTLADWQRERSGGIADDWQVEALLLRPEREWLYDRCDRRFAAMLDADAIAEIEILLTRNLDPALPVMRAIGVREVAGLIQGELSRTEALLAGQLATRQYAKRQYTWFRGQSPATWQRVVSQNYLQSSFRELLLRL